MILILPEIKLKTLDFYFLTINYHHNDIPLFNLNLSELIIPFVEEESTAYYWCVEKDNTKSMHFHAILGGNWRDVGALRQKLHTLLKKCLKGSKCETKIDHLLKGQCVNLSGKLINFKSTDGVNKLGYIQKESSRNPRKATNIPDITLEKSLENYLNSNCILSDSTRHKETIVNLKGTNILSNMLDFIIISDLNVKNLSWEEMEDFAIDFGYSFISVSSYQKEQCDKEIRRRLYPINDGYDYNTLQGVSKLLQSLVDDIGTGLIGPQCIQFTYDLIARFNISARPEKNQSVVTNYFKNFNLDK